MKQRTVRTFLKQLALLGALGALQPLSSASALDTSVLWNARLSSLRGDLSCKYGDPDCNRCVYDVVKQFNAIARSDAEGKIRIWEWGNNDHYDPANRTVESVLTVTPRDSAHFQSVARAPSSDPNFLATYAGPDGGVFMIDMKEKPNGRAGDGKLSELHSANTTHPGGIQGIGQYFTVASYQGAQAYLEVFDASSPLTPARQVAIEDVAAASVAGARVAGGGYVFFTNVNSKENAFRLWYTASLEAPHFEAMWEGQIVSANQPDLGQSDGYQGYEGLSMVTECGTGQLYMIGVQGDPGIVGEKGIWTLHKLSAGGDGARLEYVSRNTNDMHRPGCNTRAGGSAFAGKYGNLGLYCGQKGQEEAQRIYAIMCGSSVTYGLAVHGFGVPPDPIAATISWIMGGVGCKKALLDDNEAAITEYWASGPTPETPPEQNIDNVKLSVQAQGHVSLNPDGSVRYVYGQTDVFIMVDETPGDDNHAPDRLETCSAENVKTCDFYVKRGSKVSMMAAGGGPASWLDPYCSSHSNGDSFHPTCELTINANTQVSAASYVVL